MISSYLPYPLFSGGQVRLYNLIKELSSRHEITLICEKRSSQTIEDIEAIEKICKKVITVQRRKQWSAKNILKSGFSAQSFLVTGHTLSEMQEKIKEELEKNSSYDFIHVETYYVMQNLPKTNIPVVLVEHNIEYTVYEKFKNRAPLPLRPLLDFDILKIKKEEERYWKKADVLVAVSLEDKKIMEKAGFVPYLVSNGVNTDQFIFKNINKALERKEKKILFIGDFKWIQNRDSVTFIIKEIWPEIKQQYLRHSGKRNTSRISYRCNESDSGQARMTKEESLKLWIVGRSIPNSVRSLTTDPDVLFDEESSAKPTPEIFQEATVLLSPIRVGGGTSYKILESMSCGTPVITMQLSADAIQAKDGHDIMVGNTTGQLAEKTLSLLEDNALYEKLSKNGRVLIEKKYTWKEISKKLEEVYLDVLKNNPINKYANNPINKTNA